jgi:hypothetical protein
MQAFAAVVHRLALKGGGMAVLDPTAVLAKTEFVTRGCLAVALPYS